MHVTISVFAESWARYAAVVGRRLDGPRPRLLPAAALIRAFAPLAKVGNDAVDWACLRVASFVLFERLAGFTLVLRSGCDRPLPLLLAASASLAAAAILSPRGKDTVDWACLRVASCVIFERLADFS